MTRKVFLVAVFGLLGGMLIWVQQATAAPAPPPATVSWAGGAPVSGTVPGQGGTITGGGSWKANPGWNPMGQATMTAIPTGGGTALSANGPIGGPPANVWGLITIKNVPTGQYTVYATINFTDGTNTVAVNSPTAIVNVP